jgi:epsilon-lactone hydrolase
MVTLQAAAMRLFLRMTFKRKRLETIEAMRAMVDSLEGKPHKNVRVEKASFNGLKAEWLLPNHLHTDGIILYLHGGGYVSGSPSSHRGTVSQIVNASGVAALLLDYRLAPEHPYPAALEDATQAYKWLLSEGYAPQQIIIAGDSAGGGLTLATLLKLRDEGVPLPAGAATISPWTDLEGTGESVHTRARQDPWLKPGDLHLPVNNYTQGQDTTHPYISPLHGDLRGLPPLLIQVGDAEILLSDSERFAAKAQAMGVDVSLKIWPGMWHVWHAFYAVVPEAKRAIEELAEFVKHTLLVQDDVLFALEAV